MRESGLLWRLPNQPLQELALGQWVEVNGERRRVVALTIGPAAEDDPELGIEVGDMVTTVTFSEPDAAEADREGVAG